MLKTSVGRVRNGLRVETVPEQAPAGTVNQLPTQVGERFVNHANADMNFSTMEGIKNADHQFT
jgi:hypothetical protein